MSMLRRLDMQDAHVVQYHMGISYYTTWACGVVRHEYVIHVILLETI